MEWKWKLELRVDGGAGWGGVSEEDENCWLFGWGVCCKRMMSDRFMHVYIYTCIYTYIYVPWYIHTCVYIYTLVGKCSLPYIHICVPWYPRASYHDIWKDAWPHLHIEHHSFWQDTGGFLSECTSFTRRNSPIWARCRWYHCQCQCQCQCQQHQCQTDKQSSPRPLIHPSIHPCSCPCVPSLTKPIKLLVKKIDKVSAHQNTWRTHLISNGSLNFSSFFESKRIY